ncbi:MAG: RidA family protein [Pseudobdellovibrionaceae bacterium]
MSKKIILTNQSPAPVGPYSQAVQQGPFLFCSGQIAIDPKTNEVLKDGVQGQAKLVMENIRGLLQAADYDLKDIVKTTIYLTNMNDFATVNEVYASYFKDNHPARSTIGVAALPKGLQVEIEVLAYK